MQCSLLPYETAFIADTFALALLQTATRSVQEVFPSVGVDLLSNAPFAHRSEEAGEDAIQSKVRLVDLHDE